MKRSAVALITLLLVAGCSDGRDGASMVAGPGSVRTARVLENLETVEELIDALFRGGNATAARARWNTVLRFAARGDVVNARKHAFDLADFLVKKQRQGQLLDPDGTGGATTADGVSKLLALMLGVAFPGAPAPVGDATVALIDGSAQTVVTPLKRAGIELDAGSTTTPFLLVIDEDPATHYQRCSGPLATTRCQFPLFYRFTPYPDTRLTKLAKFGVCTMEQEHAYGPWGEAQHERMRLAHNVGGHTPTDPSRVVEGIEVLPLAEVDFLECEEISYGPPILLGLGVGNPLLRGAVEVASTLGRGIGRALTPKNAYAIDRGGGGEADFFSPFNAVDTATLASAVDLTTSQASVAPALAQIGEQVTLAYTVTNAGTAASPEGGLYVAITGGEITEMIDGAFPLPSLDPGESVQGTITFLTPELSPGVYQVSVIADGPNAIEESSETNNSASTQLLVPDLVDGATFTLSARGTGVVDGVLNAAEWANSQCRVMTFSTPDTGTTQGKLCIMSDASTVYFGVIVERNVAGDTHSASFEFDNDANGWLSAGDDGIGMSTGDASSFDLVRYNDPEIPCVACSAFDISRGGTNEGAGALHLSPGYTSYEFSKPLDSGDSLDFSLSPGGSIGFFLFHRIIKSGGTYPTGFGDTSWPGFGVFATLNLAP